jgi:hypothetical protein
VKSGRATGPIVSFCIAAHFVCLFLFASAATGGAQSERRPLGEIDFFGYKGLDLDVVRAALPLRAGELLSPEDTSSGNLKQRIRQAITRAIGRDPTDVAFVCCDDRGNWMIYIGLPGNSSKAPAYNAAPHEDVRFPPEVVKLSDEMEDAVFSAVVHGNAGEDDSKGYSLSVDPALRAKEMALRRYALGNEPAIVHVLEASSDAKHRAIAAGALGYARASKRQVSALVRACLDPDDGVRNNAARALGILAGARGDLARGIPATVFIQLLGSGIWTDHNKAVWVLDGLTRRRDAEALKQLREKALDNLLEMARWKNRGHSGSALTIVGRIAGIEEKRLQELIGLGQADEIIRALAASTQS